MTNLDSFWLFSSFRRLRAPNRKNYGVIKKSLGEVLEVFNAVVVIQRLTALIWAISILMVWHSTLPENFWIALVHNWSLQFLAVKNHRTLFDPWFLMKRRSRELTFIGWSMSFSLFFQSLDIIRSISISRQRVLVLITLVFSKEHNCYDRKKWNSLAKLVQHLKIFKFFPLLEVIL